MRVPGFSAGFVRRQWVAAARLNSIGWPNLVDCMKCVKEKRRMFFAGPAAPKNAGLSHQHHQWGFGPLKASRKDNNSRKMVATNTGSTGCFHALGNILFLPNYIFCLRSVPIFLRFHFSHRLRLFRL
jgi:hypothetical protein